MLQLKNATPFSTSIAVFPNEQGIDTLYTMIKASFIMENDWVLADEQNAPTESDEYWGEPEVSSIKYASDFHTGKPATDIIMIGQAHAPRQKPVEQLDVQLSVGHLNKTVRVIGDRQWQGGQISSPKPFVTMPVVYERAYGGQHQIDEHHYLAEERNPVGCGFVGKRSRRELEGMALPNIEDPNDLMTKAGDQPIPTGFGACAPNWMPRRQFAGTYDDAWQKTRAPYLPQDFDSRFLNAAHPDCIYSGYLKGGEPVSISHMHPDGLLQMQLPMVKFLCELTLQGQRHPLETHMDTVTLEPNEKKISLLWRTHFPCDKKVLSVEEISIKLLR